MKFRFFLELNSESKILMAGGSPFFSLEMRDRRRERLRREGERGWGGDFDEVEFSMPG